MAHRALFRGFFFLCSCTWFLRETLNTPHRALSGACFSCLLAHVSWPCLVLHRTMQHGSTCSSVQQKNVSADSKSKSLKHGASNYPLAQF